MTTPAIVEEGPGERVRCSYCADQHTKGCAFLFISQSPKVLETQLLFPPEQRKRKEGLTYSLQKLGGFPLK